MNNIKCLSCDIAFKWEKTAKKEDIMSDGNMCCVKTKQGKVNGNCQGYIVDKEFTI